MDPEGAPYLCVRTVTCPYCGEPVETTVDSPQHGVRYIEDCSVCCQPIEFRVTTAADGDFRVTPGREND